MSYFTYATNISRILELVEKECTGTAECLAGKLKVSRRSVFRYLDCLRSEGIEISFSKIKNSYCFKNNSNITKDFL